MSDAPDDPLMELRWLLQFYRDHTQLCDLIETALDRVAELELEAKHKDANLREMLFQRNWAMRQLQKLGRSDLLPETPDDYLSFMAFTPQTEDR